MRHAGELVDELGQHLAHEQALAAEPLEDGERYGDRAPDVDAPSVAGGVQPDGPGDEVRHEQDGQSPTAITVSGVSERRTGAGANRARRASRTGVPNASASQATAMAAFTTPTASVRGAQRECIGRTMRRALQERRLQRRLLGHQDPEQPEQRHGAAGEPQEALLDSREEMPGGVGEHQIGEQQRREARADDADAEQQTVARSVQQPQRREQPDADEQRCPSAIWIWLVCA